MLVRLVKLTFRSEEIAQFLVNFELHKAKLLNFKGCQFVELLRSNDDESVFFTHSHWDDEKALERYRKSELFNAIWSKTKPMFREKAEAWSLQAP